MITCRQITGRVCSCYNCNRITPLNLEYKFIDVTESEIENTFTKVILCEDCSNAISTLSHNVKENGKSFKYVKDEFKELEEI